MDKVKYEKTKTHQTYKTRDGNKVPGVTTVLGIINKPALLAWAWQCGMDGIDFRKSKDKAADIGTIAHFLIECHLKGVEPDTSEFAPADLSRAETAYIKWLSWWDAGKFTFIASEIQLVSEKHKYGGTLDIVAKDSAGITTLIDLKTGKGIYDEMWFQVNGAYRQLWDELHPDDEVERVIICRIGKEEQGDFETQERIVAGRDFEIFIAALNLYRLLKNK
jgi:hypothetical protein